MTPRQKAVAHGAKKPKPMRNAFDIAFEELMLHEGGYVDHPNDRGGATKYGISSRSYPNINIMGLTKEDAKQIYRKDFWNKLDLDRLRDEDLACMVFDGAVNAGRSRSVRWLQAAFNTLFHVQDPDGLLEDGILGPITVRTVNSVYGHRDALRMAYVLNRGQHYLGLVKRHEKYRVFLRGWLDRLWHNAQERFTA